MYLSAFIILPLLGWVFLPDANLSKGTFSWEQNQTQGSVLVPGLRRGHHTWLSFLGSALHARASTASAHSFKLDFAKQKSRFCHEYQPFPAQNPGARNASPRGFLILCRWTGSFALQRFCCSWWKKMQICARFGLCDLKYAEIENFK